MIDELPKTAKKKILKEAKKQLPPLHRNNRSDAPLLISVLFLLLGCRCQGSTGAPVNLMI